MRRRVLTLAIAVVLICSLFTSFAFAATLRASDYISSYNAVIYSSGTKINVDCSITGTGRMKTLALNQSKFIAPTEQTLLHIPIQRTGMSILWEATPDVKQHPSHIRALRANPIMQ